MSAGPTIELLRAADAEDRQRRIAGGLLAVGLRPGDRVVLRTPSTGDMLAAILGALRVGIVPVLLHAGLLEHERALLLEDAAPDLVIDEVGLSSLLAAEPTELAPWPLARPMHYTSGTTGHPKGVWSGVLEEAEAAALVAEERDLWGFAADDVHLVCSPFHHSVAIRFSAGTLLAGGDVAILGPFDAERAIDALHRIEPTTTFMVPAHLQRVFAASPTPPLAGLRLLAHAGSPCPAPLKRRVLEAAGDDVVWEFYGSTEGQFTVCSAEEWRERPGTVGRARRHRSLEVDPDGTVWCAVPEYARFSYWRAPEATAAAWRPAPPGAPGPSAFTVGDLGRLDDDGYLFLDGRRDDLVITGGVNVYPAEVEQALVAIPGVSEAAVFGVDDDRWGQRVCVAFVGDAAPEDVVAGARERLAAHKRPKQAFAVASLPHTTTGKVQRNLLAGLLGLGGKGRG